MFDSHPLALAIATVAAFLVANVYYAVFARQLAAARGDSSTDAGVAPWRVVAVHGGEWLVKLSVVSVILGILR